MRKAYSWGLLALASVTQARADDVTEEQFLASLNEGHAAVRALGDDLVRAQAARRRAGTLGNPRLEFWREQADANPMLTNWTLAWTPPLDGRFGLGKKAADAGVAAAGEELALDRAGLRREMRRVFAEWSLGHQRCALLSLRLERVAALAEQERQRARVGAESGLSARRLALAEAESRAALREAEAARARAEAEARAWQPGLGGDAVPVVPALAGLKASMPAARPGSGRSSASSSRRSSNPGLPAASGGFPRFKRAFNDSKRQASSEPVPSSPLRGRSHSWIAARARGPKPVDARRSRSRD